MRALARSAALVLTAALSGCSACGERPVASVDAGPSPVPSTVVTPMEDAGVGVLANTVTDAERPFDYPSVDDAPGWAWPIVRQLDASGRRQLEVVGWSKNITNPQLAMSVAQARARANLVKALQGKGLNQPGASEGLASSAVVSKTFRSNTGAIFTAVTVDLP